MELAPLSTIRTFAPSFLEAATHPQDAMRISYHYMNSSADEPIKQQMIDGVIPHKNPIIRAINNFLGIGNK